MSNTDAHAVNHKYLHVFNRGECVESISFPQNSNKILYCLTADLWNSVKYEQVGVTPLSGRVEMGRCLVQFISDSVKVCGDRYEESDGHTWI